MNSATDNLEQANATSSRIATPAAATPEPAPLPRSKWRPGGFLLSGIFLALLVAAVWGGYSLWKHSLQRQIDGQIAEIRARGEPVWFADLQRDPLPAAENGRDEFLRAWRRYDEARDRGRAAKTSALWTYLLGASANSGVYPTADQQSRNEIRAMQAEIPEVFQLIQQAMDKPHIQFDYDYDTPAPWATLLGHVQFARDVSDMWQNQALAARFDGNRDEELQLVANHLILAQRLESEPFVVSFLVRTSILMEGIPQLETALATGPLDDATFKQIDELLQTSEASLRARDAILAERAAAMSSSRLASAALLTEFSNNNGALDAWTRQAYASLEVIRLQDQQLALDYYSRLAEIVDEPGPAATDEMHELERLVAGFPETAIMANAFTQPEIRRIVLWRRQRLVNARFALRIAQHWHQTGLFPNTLEEACDGTLAQVPPGLLTGRPLQFRVIRDKSAVGFEVFEPIEDGPLDVAQPKTRFFVEFKATPNNAMPNSGAGATAIGSER